MIENTLRRYHSYYFCVVTSIENYKAIIVAPLHMHTMRQKRQAYLLSLYLIAITLSPHLTKTIVDYLVPLLSHGAHLLAWTF
jgi:hypothetical protein